MFLTLLAIVPSIASEPAAAALAYDPTAASATLKNLSLEELMNITVTSVSRRPEKLSDTASAIQVITGEEIRRSGATSIPEALRLADNLDVARRNAHDWAISARGFNTDTANKLLVMIDGRTVYTPLFSGVFWDRQDVLLEDIERIEVISGPGGALWGANAVNGVINIITKSASDTQGAYLEAGGGTQLQGFTGARYGGALAPGVDYRVYGKFWDRDDEALATGGAASDSWNHAQGGFRIDGRLSDSDTFTVQGDAYGNDENIATGGDAAISGANVLGRWSRSVTDLSRFKLQLYYDYTHLSLPVPAAVTPAFVLAPPGDLDEDLHTFDLDFQHDFVLSERHRIVWGFGYRFTHDVVDNAPALAFDPRVLDQHLYSAFIQDDIALSRVLTLTLGTKIEHNDYTDFEFEPSVRITWAVADQHTLWAAVSRAVRAPSRVDRDERLPTPALSPLVDNLLIGGRDFESETVLAYEAGYRAQLGSRLSASIATYYNNYRHLRSTAPSPPPALFGLPLEFQNDLTGHTYGLELSIDYQLLEWWRLHAGYALFEEHLRVRPGHVDFNNALNETADPKHRVALRSAMNLPGNVELDAGLRWVDTRPTNNAGVVALVPSYFEFDVRLGWRPLSNLELSLVGQNLLHEDHVEYFSSPPNPRQAIRRGIYGKLSWWF